MIHKKKFFVISFSLLLVALLGMFSTCYASIEIGQIQNFIYNASIEQNYSKQDLDNWFLSSTVWNSFKTDVLPYLTDNYEQLLINNGYNIYVLWRPTETNYKVNIRNINTNIDPTTYDITANGFKGFHFRFNDNTFYKNNTYTSTSFNSVHLAYSTADWYYNNVIYFSSPFGVPNDSVIDGEYFTNIIWEYVSNGYNVTLQNDNQWTYRLISGGWGIHFGTITDSEWVGKISYRVAYWNNGLRKFGAYGNYITLYDYEKNGPLYNYWSGSTTNSNGLYSTRIILDNYKYQNCLLQILIEPTTHGELTNIYQDYYIESNNTVVQNGVVITSDIFSGDYVGDYNQQEQTNNQNDNTDKIIDTLTEFDSGDLTGVIDFGEEPNITDPTSNFITYLIDRISTSFLNDYTNTYIDIPFYVSNNINSSYRVYARDFDFIPEALKTLIGMIFMIAFFKYYFTKIHDLVTAVQSAQIGSFAEKIKGGLNVTDIL